MSTTLTFLDAAWVAGRSAAVAGRHTDALIRLAPLLTADCPPRLAAPAHRLAGRVYAAQGKWAKARSHLRVAARLKPTNSAMQHEIGLAYEDDPYGCDRRAARRFRKAIALDPRNAVAAAALGRAQVRLNRVNAGVRQLTAAAELAPGDVAVLAVVVDGLCEAGRVGVAERVVRAAAFLRPGDRRVNQLRQAVRFAMARVGQKRPKVVAATGPAVLKVVGGYARQDGPSRPTPHVGWLKPHRAERR